MTTTTIRPDHLAAIEAARLERDVAMDLATQADRDGWDRKVIDTAIAAFAGRGLAFSANDVRPLLPEVRPALIGARFYAASVRGLIRRAGYTPSTSKSTHAHPVAVWIATNRSH